MAEQNPTNDQKHIFDRFEQTKKTEARLTSYMAALNEKRVYAQDWMETNMSDIAAKYHTILDAANTSAPNEWQSLLEADNSLVQVALYIPVDETGKKLATHLMEKAEGSPDVQDKISNVPLGIPRNIFDHIDKAYQLNDDTDTAPKPEGPKNTDLSGKKEIESPSVDTDFQEKKYSFWDKVTGKDKEDTGKLQADLQTAEKRLLSVQTDQPYYIDSFFDWIEDSALVTKSAKYQQSETVANDALQNSYKDPAYMLRTAQGDLDETIDAYTECANDMARDYHKLVTAFEKGNATDVADTINGIKDTPHAARIHSLAMSGAAQQGNEEHISYVDWAFKNFDTPHDQALLLTTLQESGEEIAFKAHPTNVDKFKMIFEKVLDTASPMPVTALTTLLQDMHQKNEWSTENLIDFIIDIEPSPLQQVVATYRDDKNKINDLFNIMLNPMRRESLKKDIPDIIEVIDAYTQLLEADDNQDLNALFKVLPEDATIEAKRIAKQMMVVAYAIDPEFNLIDMITDNFSHNSLGDHNIVNLWAHAFAYGADMPTAASFDNSAAADTDIAAAISDKMIDIAYANAHQLEDVEQAIRNIQEVIIQENGIKKWQDILTNKRGHADQGLIAKINEISQNKPEEFADMLRIVMAPISDNAERTAILNEAADLIKDTDTHLLTQLSASLGGYYQNIRGETILNPDNAQNIWASNEGVFYNSHGSSSKVDAQLTPADSLNYIQILAENHQDYTILGDELIKPSEISFGWVESSNTAAYFNYYHAGAQNQITLETVEEGQDFIQKLTSDAPQMLPLSEDNQIILNKDKALHVTYHDENLYQLLQFHSKAGKEDAVYLETECPADNAAEILASLAQSNDALYSLNDGIINLDEINLCWYDPDAACVQYIMKGITFYTDEEGEVLKDSPFPGLSMSETEANDMLSAFVARSDDHIQINGLFFNTRIISSLSYDTDKEEMLIQTEQRDITSPIDAALAQVVLTKLAQNKDFTAGQDSAGNQAVIHNQSPSYVFANDDQTQTALVYGNTFTLQNSRLPTGDSWLQPVLFEAAFNMNNIDEISLKTGNKSSPTALVIKSHGMNNEIALDNAEHGRAILADIVKNGREKLPVSDTANKHVEKLDLNATPALAEEKSSPIEYGILSAKALFNQSSLKANENIQSLFKRQASCYNKRQKNKAKEKSQVTFTVMQLK